ncbi:hypothetical protein [Prescottella agglutinans]|uniref:Uncharacterized protein n=1 Tax=Prescottella agglutinans TaxID=1644129 RepID=A0ABT6M4W5_9NOCA|nr:hypothetical protein [Prescottella agglutinans]MDH6279342.1 hypothetical protein [Prescottella agglutinans]
MIVKHPTVAGVQYDVPNDKAQDWVDAGWVAEQAPSPTAAPVADPENTSEASEPSRPSNSRKKD